MAPTALGMLSALLSHYEYGEWRESLMVSGDSVCDSWTTWQAGKTNKKKVLNTRGYCFPLLFLLFPFLWHVRSAKEERVMAPMEENRSQFHGCFFCSISAFIIDWFSFLCGDVKVSHVSSKYIWPDVLPVSHHQAPFLILWNNCFQCAFPIFATPSVCLCSCICLAPSLSILFLV